MCVLHGNPSRIKDADYLKDVCCLPGRAAEAAADRGDEERYVLPELVYRVAQAALGRLQEEALAQEARAVVVPAPELDA